MPKSQVFKKFLREALSKDLKPLSYEELRELQKRYRGRKRVYLSKRDRDLEEFFDRTPLSMQYAVYLYVNNKLVEGQAMKRFAVYVYLFPPFDSLYKKHFIGNRLIAECLREIKESGETIEPISRKGFEELKQNLGEGKIARILLPPDLQQWYINIPESLKKALWLKLHHKLKDKLQTFCQETQKSS